jgi:hypothetical protein
MHVVLGAGNLGCDIMSSLLQRELPCILFSTTVNNWKYPCSIKPILNKNPKHIWVCVGESSPLLNAWDVNVRLAIELIEKADKYTFLHFFSAFDLLDERLLTIKKQMETVIESSQRPNTNIYRVSHLYGKWKPKKGFLYNVAKGKFSLDNFKDKMICPTCTDWIAEQVIPYALEKKWGSITVTPQESVLFSDYISIIRDNTYLTLQQSQ